MNQVKKFYLKHAVYLVEVDGHKDVLLMNYSGNTFEIIGNKSGRVAEIAQMLLNKKHGVNFAYKFNGVVDEEYLQPRGL